MDKMKELYAKVAGDTALQAKFDEIMKDAAKGGEAVKEKLTAFAKEAGYDVSMEEALEFFKALAEQTEGELSDTELDAVAGGKRSGKGMGLIASSVLSFGTSCYAISLRDMAQDEHCSGEFD
jgi:predicted ribosomally synthesized peptide with nif11-like leader